MPETMNLAASYRVPFMDLAIDDAEERSELLAAIDTVLQHGRFLLGPEVEALERKVADYCGRSHGIGLGSGTDAIYVALRALDIGPGDEVVTSALSWLASGTTIALTGATPVFADAADDLNIDPASVEKLITSKTKVLMPVHFAGKVSNMQAIRELAQDHGLTLIEDASQAFGATRDGRPAGATADVAVFSLNPMKVFAACGEAGIALTDDEILAERMRELRYHGMIDKETTPRISSNARLDTLQAAILLKRLNSVDAAIRRRGEIAACYNASLSDRFFVPRETAGAGNRDAWFVYTLRSGNRQALFDHLLACGVEAKLRERRLVPDQPVFAGKARGNYPNARKLIDTLICLPLHGRMTDQDVDYVIEAVESFDSEAA